MPSTEPTLSETLEDLKAKGYTEDFNLKGDCIDCHSGQLKILPSDFVTSINTSALRDNLILLMRQSYMLFHPKSIM